MPSREERIAEAAKHIGLVRRVFAEDTKAVVESAKLYKEGEARALADPKPSFDTTDVRVERTDTVSALRVARSESEGGRVCALDFASYTNPGGGYDRGAWAQEEALCAESNLFEILSGLRELYYTPNKQTIRGGLYSDRALYLTDVLFTAEAGPFKRDVIVCAAPNRSRAMEANRSAQECDNDMRRRVVTVLQIAADQHVESLVLGAFGCGVFGNDPVFVASAFKEWIDAHPGVFREVVFAVPGGPNLSAFEDVFGRTQHEAVEVAEDFEPEEDTSEDDAWLADNASSDGHWVFN